VPGVGFSAVIARIRIGVSFMLARMTVVLVFFAGTRNTAGFWGRWEGGCTTESDWTEEYGHHQQP
jgi:hypothetical protein